MSKETIAQREQRRQDIAAHLLSDMMLLDSAQATTGKGVKPMKITIDKREVVIRMPIKEQVSKSTKNILLATTGGNRPTTCEYKGKVVTAGINIYVPNDDYTPSEE